MPQLIDCIDAIARKKQRGVLLLKGGSRLAGQVALTDYPPWQLSPHIPTAPLQTRKKFLPAC